MTTLETVFTGFILATNTIVQVLVSKKDIKLYMIVWVRDLISALMFIYLGLYWQIYIIAWQFLLTFSGYLCWRHSQKYGTNINQLQLIKLYLEKWQKFMSTTAKSAEEKRNTQ